MKPYLIGESNPYSDDPKFALYPRPRHSAGGRLCLLVLGMPEAEYLRTFERRDLLKGPKWSKLAAGMAAAKLLEESAGAPLVLLGAKVHEAFGYPYEPFMVRTRERQTLVLLPHPSGLSRAWGERGALERARALVSPLLQERSAA